MFADAWLKNWLVEIRADLLESSSKLEVCYTLMRYTNPRLLYCTLLQIVMPKFPVIVKIGHAYAGIGKVRALSIYKPIIRVHRRRCRYTNKYIMKRHCRHKCHKNRDTAVMRSRRSFWNLTNYKWCATCIDSTIQYNTIYWIAATNVHAVIDL